MLGPAPRKISCICLAFQVESYFKSKNKLYDGSDTMKMTSVDCTLIEEKIEEVPKSYVRPGQRWAGVECLGLHKLVDLSQVTRAITKELNSLTTTEE